MPDKGPFPLQLRLSRGIARGDYRLRRGCAWLAHLGYAAWLWCDLGNQEFTPEEQRRRLQLFVEAYGDVDVQSFVRAAILRQQMLERLGNIAMSIWARLPGVDAKVSAPSLRRTWKPRNLWHTGFVRDLIFACLLVLLLGACRPPERESAGAAGNDVARTITTILPEGAQLGPSPVLVTVEEGGSPVSGASVRITGDMTHAGMVPVIVEAEERDIGEYLAEDFAFSMAGDWILTVEVGYPDGSREMRELEVNIPGR